MKAILCSQYGGPDDLVLTDVADPVAGPGEAVIAIKSAALNFFDLLMIQGKYQIKPPFPFSPAAEVAGVIESVGSGVSDLKPGDRVIASCGHNGAREKIALPANAMVKIPDNLDFDRAAGIIIIYGTALHALEDRASLKPGETMAVLGAAGGTGLAACELGKLMGLKVIACASSDEKLDFAKAHGAELGLNYAQEDLKEGLRRLTGGKGVDIVFDPVGGSYAEAALRSIAWEGRFLVIGFAAGENGNGGLIWYLPWIIRMSKKFSAAALIAITAWPASATGSGTSASTRSSGWQYCEQRTAFMGTPEFRRRK